MHSTRVTIWPDRSGHRSFALDGTVVAAGATGEGPGVGFENWVIIDSNVNGKPVSTVYGHMFSNGIRVKQGQQVKAGDHIADIGNAGGSTGPHLHFEYWEAGCRAELPSTR